MSYREAMEAAGAVVHEMEYFGDYQGSWWAYVTYHGETGWVAGHFGSCSGCDAFQSEFDYAYAACDEHRYNGVDVCPDCDDAARDYDRRLVSFGRGYLNNMMTSQEALADASGDLEWDSEAQQMVNFIARVSGVSLEEEEDEETEENNYLSRLGVLH